MKRSIPIDFSSRRGHYTLSRFENAIKDLDVLNMLIECRKASRLAVSIFDPINTYDPEMNIRAELLKAVSRSIKKQIVINSSIPVCNSLGIMLTVLKLDTSYACSLSMSDQRVTDWETASDLDALCTHIRDQVSQLFFNGD